MFSTDFSGFDPYCYPSYAAGARNRSRGASPAAPATTQTFLSPSPAGSKLYKPLAQSIKTTKSLGSPAIQKATTGNPSAGASGLPSSQPPSHDSPLTLSSIINTGTPTTASLEAHEALNSHLLEHLDRTLAGYCESEEYSQGRYCFKLTLLSMLFTNH